MKIEFKCPKCQAPPNDHGKGGPEKCNDRHGRSQDSGCMGFICECDNDGSEGHGESFEDPCPSANCYHCGWGGTFPTKPKGLQAWEKKALDAGWTPPEARKKELGL
jgi:hypothetical protein